MHPFIMSPLCFQLILCFVQAHRVLESLGDVVTKKESVPVSWKGFFIMCSLFYLRLGLNRIVCFVLDSQLFWMKFFVHCFILLGVSRVCLAYGNDISCFDVADRTCLSVAINSYDTTPVCVRDDNGEKTKWYVHCWPNCRGPLQMITAMLLEQKYLELLEKGRKVEALKCLRTEISALPVGKERIHELTRYGSLMLLIR